MSSDVSFTLCSGSYVSQQVNTFDNSWLSSTRSDFKKLYPEDEEGNTTITISYTDGREEIVMVSAGGMAIRIAESDIRKTGRVSMGVIGMRLNEGDSVIAMQIKSQGPNLLVVSENGMGKQTPFDEFHVQGRGGKGVLCYKINEKTGKLVAAKLTGDNTDILLITKKGTLFKDAT